MGVVSPCVTCDVKYEIIGSFFLLSSTFLFLFGAPLSFSTCARSQFEPSCSNAMRERQFVGTKGSTDIRSASGGTGIPNFGGGWSVGSLHLVLSILECPTACLLHLDLART